MNNDKCCEKCEDKLKGNPDLGYTPMCAFRGNCPCHTPPQEEPWVAESYRIAMRCCAALYEPEMEACAAELKLFIQKTLEADRKERAGVVVERIEKEYDNNDYTDEKWPKATEHEKDGWNAGLRRAVEIIRDVMK